MPIWILPICYFMLVVQSNTNDLSAFLQEHSASWFDYRDKINGLQCFVKKTVKLDGNIRSTDQSFACYSKNSGILSTRTPSQDITKRLAPHVHLIRVNHGQIEQFRIMSQIAVDTDTLDLTSGFLHRKHDWILTSEKIVSNNPGDFTSYRMTSLGGGLIVGFKLAAFNVLLPEYLLNHERQISRFKRFGDRAEIEIEFGSGESVSKFIRSAKCQFEKLGHWLITSVEVEYNPSFTYDPNWKLQNSKATLDYIKLGELSVPSSFRSVITLKDSTGQHHLEETVTTYSVSKFEDESLLLLPTYGIPEHSVKPDLPAPISTVDSSTVESVPLWAWLTAFAVILLVVGLLLRRSPKAKRA